MFKLHVTRLLPQLSPCDWGCKRERGPARRRDPVPISNASFDVYSAMVSDRKQKLGRGTCHLSKLPTDLFSPDQNLEIVMDRPTALAFFCVDSPFRMLRLKSEKRYWRCERALLRRTSQEYPEVAQVAPAPLQAMKTLVSTALPTSAAMTALVPRRACGAGPTHRYGIRSARVGSRLHTLAIAQFGPPRPGTLSVEHGGNLENSSASEVRL